MLSNAPPPSNQPCKPWDINTLSKIPVIACFLNVPLSNDLPSYIPVPQASRNPFMAIITTTTITITTIIYVPQASRNPFRAMFPQLDTPPVRTVEEGGNSRNGLAMELQRCKVAIWLRNYHLFVPFQRVISRPTCSTNTVMNY